MILPLGNGDEKLLFYGNCFPGYILKAIFLGRVKKDIPVFLNRIIITYKLILTNITKNKNYLIKLNY